MNPYKDEAFNKIYDLLFCDNVDLYRESCTSPDIYPWKDLLAANPSDEALKKIIDDNDAEARHKALAAHLLAMRGISCDNRRIFGVIVEVGMDEGLDVLAAYSDGTARYINYSEKLIVWETRTQESDQLVGDLFHAANTLVEQIGPWDGARRPPPAAGNARLTFLVSDGLYFGEGQLGALSQDPLGAPVIDGAIKLMTFLIDNATDQSP
jgi:hypothetical protein